MGCRCYGNYGCIGLNRKITIPFSSLLVMLFLFSIISPHFIIIYRVSSLSSLLSSPSFLLISQLNYTPLLSSSALLFSYRILLSNPPFSSSFLQWFLDKLGHEGLNNLLLAYPDKSAYAQCVVAYCEGPGCEIKVQWLTGRQGREGGRGDNVVIDTFHSYRSCDVL